MINPHPPFYTSQANSPNHFNLFLPYPFDKNRWNKLFTISIIGIIGNQWKTQTQLWDQWSSTSLPMDPVSVHMQWLQRCTVFVLFVCEIWYRLSWAWRTCPPSYCLFYFLFKIYMKNGNTKTVCINILFYPVVVLLSIRRLSICICVKKW